MNRVGGGPGGESEGKGEVVVEGSGGGGGEGLEFLEELLVMDGEAGKAKSAGFEQDSQVGEQGRAGDVVVVGLQSRGDGDGQDGSVHRGGLDQFDNWGANASGVNDEGLGRRGGLVRLGFEGGVGVEDRFGDGEIREVEWEAFGVAEVKAGDGELDVEGVVELTGEFDDAFEDDEGGMVGALAEIEAEEEVVAMRAEGWA